LIRSPIVLKLGDLCLDIPLFQAPMAGYTDRAMRHLARRYGPVLTFPGVVLAKVACHRRIVAKLKLAAREDEHPIGIQIMGSLVEEMVEAARNLRGCGYDLVDLNFACPAPKVLRRERGGSILRQPELALDIFRRVREAVDCPVMVKLRAGYDDSEAARDSFWRLCEALATEAVDALVVHGRTVFQRYRGKADWQILAELKRRFPKTTILGSGDIFSAEVIRQRLAETGVDGVTVARGAVGNPWIFRDARAVLTGGAEPPPPDLQEQGATIMEHFEMVAGLSSESRAIHYFRKFYNGYTKYHPERRQVQRALCSSTDKNELFSIVRSWYSAA